MPRLDARFDQIVLKAMQVDREERHSSALELRQHLDTLLIPTVPAPYLQRYSSAGMPRQAAPPDRSHVRQNVVATPEDRALASTATPKSKSPLFIGIGAAAAIAVDAFLLFSGSRPDVDRLSRVESAPPPAPSPRLWLRSREAKAKLRQHPSPRL